ncbi:winged helix-turn-helix domain-containing protein [Lelliottia nimipressuralis]|uniref:winged helix-turn-helix domain-containing protein n=1 Tax=Lelliottia nimipressuralis TaxID=69220 RepID=UPI0039068144
MYDIGGVIQFRSEDGALFKNNESEPFAILSATMKRLLLFLIHRQGQVCLRADILENVWDLYGLSSSNNSLNKYISDLRKIFSANGFAEDFIKTIPRAGFMLSSEVVINFSLEGDGFNLSETIHPSTDKVLFNKRINKNHLVLIFIFIVCNVFFIFLAYDVITKNLSTTGELPLASGLSIGTINECRVVLINGKSGQIDTIKKYVASDIIQRKKVSCAKNSIIYMFISEPVLFGHKGRVFFSKCNISNGPMLSHSSCKSFYEADYESAE